MLKQIARCHVSRSALIPFWGSCLCHPVCTIEPYTCMWWMFQDLITATICSLIFSLHVAKIQRIQNDAVWLDLGRKQMAVFPITHNCRSITQRFQFWHTDVRLVCYVYAHMFSTIERIEILSENKVQKAKPHLPNQILFCSANWFKSRFQKFCSSADWLKTHFLSPLSLQVCYLF